jgi:hypothetical protein
MNDNGLERILKGSGPGLIKVLPAGTEENHKKNFIGATSILAEIQTEYLPSTSQDHYF